jgi:hypothetical protein
MNWLRWSIGILAVLRAVYGLRFLFAGIAGRFGYHGSLGTSEVVTRSLAVDPILSTLTASVYLLGYLLIPWLIIRRDKRLLPVGVAVFLLDQGRWIWATSRIEDAMVHIDLQADSDLPLDMMDWTKFLVSCLVFVGVLILSYRASRKEFDS